MRKLLISVSLAATAVALWHGLYIPVSWLQPVTGPVLADRAVKLDVGHAVVSLLPTPRIRLINAELRSTISDNSLMARAGLLSLTLTLDTSNPQRWLAVDRLEAKDTEIWIDETGAEGSNWGAWPRVPPRSDHKFPLPRHFELQNSLIYFKNDAIGALSSRIDQLRIIKDGSTRSTLALRVQHPNVAGNLQASGVLTENGDNWQIDDIQSEASGQWGAHPWSLTLAVETLKRSSADADRRLSLTRLRTYVRRDDDPDEHQAVLGITHARFHPEDGRAFLRFAEWTYTHEKAEAWTFHADIDAATGLLNIAPATIPGSEGIPATQTLLSFRCAPATQTPSAETVKSVKVPAKAAWIWHDGWFFTAREWWQAHEPSPKAGHAALPVRVLACQP